MVYKLSSGAASDPVGIWTGASTNEFNSTVLNNGINGHYANEFINSWASVQRVSVRLYKGGAVTYELLFSPGQDNINWFSPQYVLSSPWTDIPRDPNWQSNGNGQFFSITGNPSNSRSWYINNNWGGCPADYGWLLISSGSDNCDASFGFSSHTKIVIAYSNVATKINWATETFGYADSMAVFVQLYEDMVVNEWQTSIVNYYVNPGNLTVNNTIPDNTTVLCRFGTLITRGRSIANNIKCLSPPLTAGVYSFDYSVDNSSTWIATCTNLIVIRGQAANEPEYEDIIDGSFVNVTWNPIGTLGSNVDIHLYLYLNSKNYSSGNLASAILFGYAVLAKGVPNDGFTTVMIPNITLNAVGYMIAVVPTGNYKRDALGAFFDVLDKANEVVDILKDEVDIPPAVILVAKWGARVSLVYDIVDDAIFVYQTYCWGNYCGSQTICVNQNRASTPIDPVDSACQGLNECVQANIFDNACYQQFHRNLWHAIIDNNCDVECAKAALVQLASSYILAALQKLFQRDIDIPKATDSGTGYGDVHYTSLDGCYFTFNGVGEFTVLQAITDPSGHPDFVVQISTMPYYRFPRAALAHAVV